MAVGQLHHPVRAVRNFAAVLGGGPAREAGHGEIEASPEEVDGAGLAAEAGAEERHDAMGVPEGHPEAVRRG